VQFVGRAGHDDAVARIAAAAVDGDPLPRPPAPTP
jgi:hypothetical protein